MTIDSPILLNEMFNDFINQDSNMIKEKDIIETISKYSIEYNPELIADLYLFQNISSNFRKGKTLLLLILCYKKEVDYNTMLKFQLCGNGKSEKRHLSNNGFVFKNIGSGQKKGLICTHFDDTYTINRNVINNNIKSHFKQFNSCFMCGSSSNLEIDHKKPIFREHNDPKTNLQNIESYQLLCNRCNSLKREVCKLCKKTGKIRNRPDILSLSNVKIEYNNTCIGCYFYDCQKIIKNPQETA